MSARVYSVPGKTERRRKVLSEWASINLSSKLSLTCGYNSNYYKSVHHSIPTLPDGKWKYSGGVQNKSACSPFSSVFRHILLLAKVKGK